MIIENTKSIPTLKCLDKSTRNTRSTKSARWLQWIPWLLCECEYYAMDQRVHGDSTAYMECVVWSNVPTDEKLLPPDVRAQVLMAVLGGYNRLGGIGFPELLQPTTWFNASTIQCFSQGQEQFAIFSFLSTPIGGFFKNGLYPGLADSTIAEPRDHMPARHYVADMEYLAACACQWRAERDDFVRSLPRGMWSFQRAIDVGTPREEFVARVKSSE
jgi:hypothetical protein